MSGAVLMSAVALKHDLTHQLCQYVTRASTTRTRRRETAHVEAVSRLRPILLQLVPATSATGSPGKVPVLCLDERHSVLLSTA